MYTGYRNRISYAERIELINIGKPGFIINLVHGKYDRFAGFLQHTRNVLIVIGQTEFSVHDKNDHIRLFEGDGYLSLNFLLVRLIGQLNTAGIDQTERMSGPFRSCVNAVSGYSRNVFHNGNTGSCDSVKNR